MKGFILVVLLVAIVAVYAQDTACKVGGDCGDWECCVDLGRRRSRVSRFIFSSGNSKCRPKRYQGQSCHVFLQHAFGSHDIFMDYCPCDEGLICQGDIDQNGHHHNPKCIPANEAATTLIYPSPSLVP